MAQSPWTNLFLSIGLLISIDAKTVTISTELGKIKGTSTDLNGETVYNFNAIPYAVPPVGDLRFRRSTLNTKSWHHTLDGTAPGAQCVQGGPSGVSSSSSMDEDCLFLNIFTTKSAVHSRDDSDALVPVMVWIHGGGFVGGSGATFNGSNFVSQQHDKVVMVTINYRLGPLGFLSSTQFVDEDAGFKSYGGMNGIYDQIVAIQWVKRYISDFGGDPERITIFGQSAGGNSVCTLLISELAKGLFNAAIIESGSCAGPSGPVSTKIGLEQSTKALIQNGWPTDNVTFLRTIPAVEFVTKMQWAFRAVDGAVLRDDPYTLLTERRSISLNAMHIINGFNSMDDFMPWTNDATPRSDKSYKDSIAKIVQNETQQEALYSTYYPPSDFPAYTVAKGESFGSYELAWWTLNADACHTCPGLELSDLMQSQKEKATVFGYVFRGAGVDGNYYAPHVSEVPFVLNTGSMESEESLFKMPWNQNLSNSMLSAWINMGVSNIPNIDNEIDGVKMEWNAYGVMENVMVLQNGNGGIRNEIGYDVKYRKNVCAFWRNEIGRDIMKTICSSFTGLGPKIEMK